MTATALENEVLNLEMRYWDAIRAKDADAALRLTDDPCIITGAQGVSQVDHESLARMMQGASWDLESYELKDVQVRLVRDDVAIVAYKVKEALTVEGKQVRLEAADSSTWIRRDGQWVCALHTEAIAGDPFGRDR